MSLLKKKGTLRSSTSKNNHDQKEHHSYIAYGSTLLIASLMGTYLDLWMVGKGYYSYPARPFSNVFSINVLFTLCILPITTFIFIYIFKRVRKLTRLILSAGSSFIAALIEHYSEKTGIFTHSNQWTHVYSIIGYFIFITLIWNFYKWISKY